ncbi:MAG: DUF459 domain-containing protein [Acidimicrobiales bacterium]
MPALDGVRALAVLGVMAYHGGIAWLGGGFLGVDAFFVLSGFLITSLLVAEWRRRRTIALGAFWSRRARRLLPALLLVLVFVACYAAFVAAPGTYPGLRLDALSSLFYVANWHFILVGANYFNQTGLPSPLTHTWSLAIEEQFYVLWPPVVLTVLAVFRHRPRRGLGVLLGVCLTGAAGSAAEMAWLFGRGASLTRLYYGTDTHAQSLLAGAALACAFGLLAERRSGSAGAGGPAPAVDGVASGDPGWVASGARWQAALAWLGLAGLVGGGVLWWRLNGNDPLLYRGGFLLAAAATAAVLVSVVAAPAGAPARLLSLRPLRFLGRISYGMYLWHYPLFVWIDGARTGLTGYRLFGVESAATVAAATLSYYLVERPIRRGGVLRAWRSWAAAPAAVVATMVAVVAATVPPAAAAHPPFGPPASASGGPTVHVLLLGDSTALTLGMGLYLGEKPYHVLQRDHGIVGCGIADGTEVESHGQVAPVAAPCNPRRAGHPVPAADQPWPEQWRRWIRQERPNVVMILAGRWEVMNRTYHGRWTDILHPAYAAYVEHQLELAVGLAGSDGARVVLLTAPCYDSGLQPDGTPWPEDNPARVDAYNRLVDEVAAEHAGNVSVIDLHAMVCPGGQYHQVLDGVTVRNPADGVHFTLSGGDLLASRIWPTVARLGRQQLATLARAPGPRG